MSEAQRYSIGDQYVLWGAWSEDVPEIPEWGEWIVVGGDGNFSLLELRVKQLEFDFS